MPFTTPATVSPGDKYNASAHNIVVADLTDLDTRLTAATAYIVPAGSLTSYVGAAAPSGWLLCDGSQVSQSTYSALYAIIGANKFGTDTGGNFFLPDLRGRVPVGLGTNADVDVIGDNDGAALADRRVKHKHTVAASATASSSATVSEATTGGQSYASIVNNTNFAAGSGIGQRAIVNSSQAGGIAGYEGLSSFGTSPNHTHSVGVTVATTVTPTVTAGPQTTVPTDGPSFLTLNFIIKT